MANINVYLIKKCAVMPSHERMMLSALSGYFEQVLASNPQWRTDFRVTVQLSTTCPAGVTDLDVVVYLVQDGSHSLFTALGASSTSGQGGRTIFNARGNQCACEVFVSTVAGTLVAKLAFHEILHNKTGLSNSQLHRHHRGGISSATFDVSTPVTNEDLQLMGTHLGARHAQWTAG